MPPGRTPRGSQAIALPLAQPLAILHRPQLLTERNADVAVGTDAEAAPCIEKARCLEDAVAEVRLRDRTQPRHRAGDGEARTFVICHVRAVDETPARTERRMVEQPLDGPRPRPGNAFFDLPRLLRRMHVHGSGGKGLEQCGEFIRRHRPQRMRCDADLAARQPREVPGRTVHQPYEVVHRAQEALLARLRRLPAAAAMRIERGQQRQPDARALGGGHDACARLGDIGIVGTIGCMMQVVELADAREAGLQHLYVEPGSDRFDILRSHLGEKAVHHLPPCPEAVVLRPTPLHEPRHGALEGVAVQVRHSRNGGAREPHGIHRNRPARSNGKDRTAVCHHDDVALPAVFRQRPVEMVSRH